MPWQYLATRHLLWTAPLATALVLSTSNLVTSITHQVRTGLGVLVLPSRSPLLCCVSQGLATGTVPWVGLGVQVFLGCSNWKNENLASNFFKCQWIGIWIPASKGELNVRTFNPGYPVLSVKTWTLKRRPNSEMRNSSSWHLTQATDLHSRTCTEVLTYLRPSWKEWSSCLKVSYFTGSFWLETTPVYASFPDMKLLKSPLQFNVLLFLQMSLHLLLPSTFKGGSLPAKCSSELSKTYKSQWKDLTFRCSALVLSELLPLLALFFN